jgi:hypothetical protein
MRVASFKLGLPPGKPRSIPRPRPDARRAAFARRYTPAPTVPNPPGRLRTSLATSHRRREIHPKAARQRRSDVSKSHS